MTEYGKKAASIRFSPQLPKKIFLLSQADRPAEIKLALLESAVFDGWIGMLININTAIFVGLIAVTAGFGPIASLTFLTVQIIFTIIGTVILLFLQIRQQSNRAVQSNIAERLIIFADLLVMFGWGFCILLFMSPLIYERMLLIIVLTTAAGIGSATLNSRLLPALILGRIILFLPSIAYCFWEQPPFWGLLICTLLFATIVSIGIGYAIHIQHLNEANLAYKLRETSVLLEQQSFALERSLSQENQAQERVLKETKLRESFLHSISHDLSQPLSALGLHLNNLAHQRLPRVADASTAAAQQCLRSAKGLIESVSQLAWIKENLPAPKLESTDIHALISRLVDELRPVVEDAGLQLTYVPTSVFVRADPEFLERVLRNLAYNAVQYTAKGRISIGVRRRPGGLAEIIVADTGLGISPGEQQHIFNAFYQIDDLRVRQSGNVGLGLSIVSDLVSAMHGRITLQSHEGKGSRFGVVLPLAADTSQLQRQESEGSAAVTNSASLTKQRILLVEDSLQYQTSIAAMIQSLGYNVEIIGDRSEIMGVSDDQLKNCDFLIVDFDLGGGLTAFDFLARSSSNLMPKCVIISQYANPDMILHIKDQGGRFLKKPFMSEDLAMALRVVEKSWQRNDDSTVS
ncbi:hybrid sensor histidine kinase/response regulator [Pararhizobium sp. IMCC21322]|uniref:ATP-binding response regulator n=1 Tax=Pararhizobium sp. IMCC21322 TaxID=3067903 RepID=UPI002742221F|nr:hybrid sensor histidine kinase/response regulator [Pararhizobium sp. IMCC21322]